MELLNGLGQLSQLITIGSLTILTNTLTYFLTLRITTRKAQNDLLKDDVEVVKAKMDSKKTLVDTIDFLEIRIAEMSERVDLARTTLYSAKEDCEKAITKLIAENIKLKNQLVLIRAELEQYKTGENKK